MASKAKTDWYRKGVKPHRVGVYETRQESGDIYLKYQFWDGKRWMAYSTDPVHAAQAANLSYRRPKPEWRGFKEQQ